ncbi:MAG: SDR family oxidoreductase [Myxococcota bacterium]
MLKTRRSTEKASERFTNILIARTFKPNRGTAPIFKRIRRQGVFCRKTTGVTMKIGLIGATGGSGRHLVDLAMAAGHEVTALARTPSKLADVADRIQVVRADGRDLDSLQDALAARFDAVVSIVGASTLMQARKVTDLYSVTTDNLITACHATETRRLIVVSSSGVEPQPNDNWFYVHILKRFFLGPMYEDMLRMEERLEASDLDYTIVRPPYLTKGAPTEKYRVSVGTNFDDDRSLRRGDLAHFLLRAVEEPEAFLRHRVALSE